MKPDTSHLVLYQMEGCPYCAKTAAAARELGLSLKTKDWMNEADREELQRGGGKTQVPCLRIAHPGGRVEWLYESAAIIGYLRTL